MYICLSSPLPAQCPFIPSSFSLSAFYCLNFSKTFNAINLISHLKDICCCTSSAGYTSTSTLWASMSWATTRILWWLNLLTESVGELSLSGSDQTRSLKWSKFPFLRLFLLTGWVSFNFSWSDYRRGHPLIKLIIENIEWYYDPRVWGCIGPWLITTCLKTFTGVRGTNNFLSEVKKSGRNMLSLPWGCVCSFHFRSRPWRGSR